MAQSEMHRSQCCGRLTYSQGKRHRELISWIVLTYVLQPQQIGLTVCLRDIYGLTQFFGQSIKSYRKITIRYPCDIPTPLVHRVTSLSCFAEALQRQSVIYRYVCSVVQILKFLRSSKNYSSVLKVSDDTSMPNNRPKSQRCAILLMYEIEILNTHIVTVRASYSHTMYM